MRTPSPELVRLCLKPPASRCEPPPPHPRFAEEKEIKSFGLWQPPGAMAPRAQRVPQPRVCPKVPGGLRGIAQTSSTLWLGRLCGVQRAPPFPPSASGRIPGAGPTPPATPAARPPAGRGRCPRPPRTTAPGVPCPAPPRHHGGRRLLRLRRYRLRAGARSRSFDGGGGAVAGHRPGGGVSPGEGAGPAG